MPRKGKFIPANPDGRTFRERFPSRRACRGASNGYFTDSFLLAEVLRPLVEREGASLSEEIYQNRDAIKGGQTVLSERASLELNVQSCSIYRRLYEVMNDISDTMKIETAEALVSAAGELFLNEPIPTFPGCDQAAWEMAEAWAEEGEDVEALARRLMRFALGWHSAGEICDPEEFDRRSLVRNSSLRNRRARERAEREEVLGTGALRSGSEAPNGSSPDAQGGLGEDALHLRGAEAA